MGLSKYSIGCGVIVILINALLITAPPSPGCKEALVLGRICNFATPEQSMKQRYYYDPLKNCCVQFSYLGCGGNDNNHYTAARCVKTCVTPTTDSDSEEIDTESERVREKSDCLQPPDPGPCRALIPMYYYNKEKGDCELFSYGGCQGTNFNRFDGMEECLNFCKGVELGNSSTTGGVGKRGMCVVT